MITGVAGLIGSNLADWISENHKDVLIVGIDDLSGGYQENIHPRVIFHKMNLVNEDLDSLFKKYRFDIVYHFAAYAAEGLSPFIRVFNYENNLIATTRLVTLSIKYDVERFVFSSSMAVYGKGDPPFKENDPLEPVDPYGIAKLACELDIKVAFDQHGLDFCIIRPHNVFGPKQNLWDKYRNVLAIWMNQHINKEPLTLFGEGNQKRAFSYIGDCLVPLWNAGINPKASEETINIGSGNEIALSDAADILIDIMGGGEKIFLESRHEVTNAWASWEKSVHLLEYQDNTPLKEGLQIMWEWARKQPKRSQYIWENLELEKGLYNFWKTT